VLRKLTFAYSLLVGLPLVLVLGTLQAGRYITGLPAISGDWLVDEQNAWRVCAKTFGASPALLRISQSGADLEIVLNDRDRTTIAGLLQGHRFALTGSVADSSAGCGGKTFIRMEGDVVGPSDRRSLVGRVSFSDCAPCELISFHATRTGARATAPTTQAP
jgi:hypothetical protein